jgi:hypothetical protein
MYPTSPLIASPALHTDYSSFNNNTQSTKNQTSATSFSKRFSLASAFSSDVDDDGDSTSDNFFDSPPSSPATGLSSIFTSSYHDSSFPPNRAKRSSIYYKSQSPEWRSVSLLRSGSVRVYREQPIMSPEARRAEILLLAKDSQLPWTCHQFHASSRSVKLKPLLLNGAAQPEYCLQFNDEQMPELKDPAQLIIRSPQPMEDSLPLSSYMRRILSLATLLGMVSAHFAICLPVSITAKLIHSAKSHASKATCSLVTFRLIGFVLWLYHVLACALAQSVSRLSPARADRTHMAPTLRPLVLVGKYCIASGDGAQLGEARMYKRH